MAKMGVGRRGGSVDDAFSTKAFDIDVIEIKDWLVFRCRSSR